MLEVSPYVWMVVAVVALVVAFGAMFGRSKKLPPIPEPAIVPDALLHQPHPTHTVITATAPPGTPLTVSTTPPPEKSNGSTN